MLAFGTYRLPPEVASTMTRKAILLGIKKIDTAQLYMNESEVYQVVKDYPEVSITTKIHRKLIRQADRDNRAIENSVQIPANEVLLHSPEKNFEIAWEQLKRLVEYKENMVVGVSNFDIAHLQQLSSLPAVNQIEVTPFNLCRSTVEYCRKNGIVIEAHSVLLKGELMDSIVINELAIKKALTPAQLMIQWSLGQGFTPIFSSRNPDHIEELVSVKKEKLNLPIELNIGYKTHPQYNVT